MTTTFPLEGARLASALDFLDGAAESLIEASHAPAAGQRYAEANLAALRAAAAVLAVRIVRGRDSRVTGPRNVWELVPELAPELGEWAVFFAYASRRRWALDDGAEMVTVREADDLVRSAQEFLTLVRGTLGLPRRADRIRLSPTS